MDGVAAAAATGTAGIPETFPAALREHGLLVRAGAGVYGWGAELERVFAGIDRVLTVAGRSHDTRVLRFPPILARAVFERSEFSVSFPQLFGAVHAFTGDQTEHDALLDAIASGRGWADATRLTGFVLTPAACYHVYPLYQGQLPASGHDVDVSSYCFRHEPSDEPGRLVSFRQREFVRLDHPDPAKRWFLAWRQKALDAIRSLGLDAWLEAAADPFFGPGARFLSVSQREQGLKYEVMARIGDHPVAVASCNYHRDHFGHAFGIQSAGGEVAHTACVGFGQERIAHALVATHGPDLERWPDEVRAALWADRRRVEALGSPRELAIDEPRQVSVSHQEGAL